MPRKMFVKKWFDCFSFIFWGYNVSLGHIVVQEVIEGEIDFFQCLFYEFYLRKNKMK